MSDGVLSPAASPTSSPVLFFPYHSHQLTTLTFFLFLAHTNLLSSRPLHFLFPLPGMHIWLHKVGFFLSFRSLHKCHNCRGVTPNSPLKCYAHPLLHLLNAFFFLRHIITLRTALCFFTGYLPISHIGMWTPCQQGQCWCWARPCAKLLEEGLAQRSGWTPTVDLMSTRALTAKWALFWASEEQTQLKEIIPLNNCPYQVTNLCFPMGSHHLLSKRFKKKKKRSPIIP